MSPSIGAVLVGSSVLVIVPQECYKYVRMNSFGIHLNRKTEVLENGL